MLHTIDFWDERSQIIDHSLITKNVDNLKNKHDKYFMGNQVKIINYKTQHTLKLIRSNSQCNWVNWGPRITFKEELYNLKNSQNLMNLNY